MKSLSPQSFFIRSRQIVLVLASLLFANSAQAQLVINEIDADTSGTDMLEFLELYDGGAGNTDLTGMVLVFYNGSNNTAYRVLDLDGLSTDGDGYFLVGNPAVAGLAQRITADTGIEIPSNGIQNGADGIALYDGLNADDFITSGATRTVPSDVVLGGGVSLVDAAVHGTGDTDDNNLGGELGVNGSILDENLDGTKDVVSVGRSPDGGTAFDQGDGVWSLLDPPTPGFANRPSGELEMFFDPTEIMENAGADAVSVRVVRDDSVGDTLVTFSGGDSTEIEFPATVLIPDGLLEVTLSFDVVDDGAADGDQRVIVIASAPDFISAEAEIIVADDGDAATLVINEISGEVEPTDDTNNDGVVNFVEDEFVEIVNISGADLDISGWELSDAEGVRHVFPTGSELGVDCALVVFGGGGFTEGIRGDFGNALVQKASTGGLGLNDSGDQIIIRQAGLERAGASYEDYNAFDGDLTRSPELTGDFVSHVQVGAGAFFSPGVRGDDGQPFCVIDEVLSLSGVTTFAEDGGASVAQYTLSRTGDTTAAITVQLGSSDPSEAVFSLATVEIPAGSDSVTVDADAVDDVFIDGTQTLELSAQALAYVSAFLGINVSDSAADTANIVINELNVDSEGTDTEEFIELYDGGIGNTLLNGYAVILVNGANDQVYEVYDLDGRSTNAAGYFVIGAPGVPNVGLTDLPGSTGFIQNGSPDAVALYLGNAADFFIGTGVSSTAVDAIVYGGTGVEGDTLGPALGLGIDRVGTDGADDTLSRFPDGGDVLNVSLFQRGIPTPGAANQSEGGDTPYDLWAAGFPGLGSRLDDVDDDGLTSITEYALGRNPLTPEVGAAVTVATVGGDLQLSVSKGTEGGADSALSYTIEVSTDLTDWSTTDLQTVTDDSDSLVVAYTGSEDRIFMRLLVDLQ